MTTGREIHAQLHLLDRQIIEKRHGRLVAKVDDLELDMTHPVPHVTALLTGPAALGPRLPGLVGRLVTTVHRRLHPDPNPGPNRISAGRIVDITSAVFIDTDNDLAVDGFGHWVDDQIIRRIPGSRHASE